jgi:hypothetical protein
MGGAAVLGGMAEILAKTTSFPAGILHSRRISHTTKTITITVPSSPKPSISFLFVRNSITTLADYAKA